MRDYAILRFLKYLVEPELLVSGFVVRRCLTRAIFAVRRHW
jgi:hypothetical protein